MALKGVLMLSLSCRFHRTTLDVGWQQQRPILLKQCFHPSIFCQRLSHTRGRRGAGYPSCFRGTPWTGHKFIAELTTMSLESIWKRINGQKSAAFRGHDLQHVINVNYSSDRAKDRYLIKKKNIYICISIFQQTHLKRPFSQLCAQWYC